MPEASESALTPQNKEAVLSPVFVCFVYFVVAHSAKADLPHAVIEILRAADDADFHPHKIDRQVAPVDLRKTDRILLRGDNRRSHSLFAAIEGVQDLLLRKAMMVGE